MACTRKVRKKIRLQTQCTCSTVFFSGMFCYKSIIIDMGLEWTVLETRRERVTFADKSVIIYYHLIIGQGFLL